MFYTNWLTSSFFSIRPNIFLGVAEGSAQYKKWYFELIIDQVEPFLTAEPTHLRVGWASTSGYAPYPGGGEGWGGNGVGDDLYSYGFDGLHLWSGKNIVHFHLFLHLGVTYLYPQNLCVYRMLFYGELHLKLQDIRKLFRISDQASFLRF